VILHLCPILDLGNKMTINVVVRNVSRKNFIFLKFLLDIRSDDGKFIIDTINSSSLRCESAGIQ